MDDPGDHQDHHGGAHEAGQRAEGGEGGEHPHLAVAGQPVDALADLGEDGPAGLGAGGGGAAGRGDQGGGDREGDAVQGEGVAGGDGEQCGAEQRADQVAADQHVGLHPAVGGVELVGADEFRDGRGGGVGEDRLAAAEQEGQCGERDQRRVGEEHPGGEAEDDGGAQGVDGPHQPAAVGPVGEHAAVERHHQEGQRRRDGDHRDRAGRVRDRHREQRQGRVPHAVADRGDRRGRPQQGEFPAQSRTAFGWLLGQVCCGHRGSMSCPRRTVLADSEVPGLSRTARVGKEVRVALACPYCPAGLRTFEGPPGCPSPEAPLSSVVTPPVRVSGRRRRWWGAGRRRGRPGRGGRWPGGPGRSGPAGTVGRVGRAPG